MQFTKRKNSMEGDPTRPYLRISPQLQRGALSFTKISDRVQLDMRSMLLSTMICPHNVESKGKSSRTS